MGLTCESIHVHWVREHVHGGWRPPFARSLSPPSRQALRETIGELGHIESAAVPEIALDSIWNAIAAAGGGEVELHLPYLRRRHAALTLAAISQPQIERRGQMVLVRTGSGLRVEATEVFRQLALTLVTATAAGTCVPFTLAFDDRLAENRVEIPGELAACWGQAPRIRERDCWTRYSQVSFALQRRLRHCLWRAFLDDMRRFEDREYAWPMLVYQAMRPVRGPSRAEFTADYLDPDRMRRRLKRAAGELPAVLAAVQDALRRAGRGELADLYCPERPDRPVAFVQLDRAPLRGLLAAESFVVDQFVRFGIETRGLRAENAAAPLTVSRKMVRLAESVAMALNVRLRRCCRGVNLAPAAPLLLIEATRALAASDSAKVKASGAHHESCRVC